MARTGLIRLSAVIGLYFAVSLPACAAVPFTQPSWGELSTEQKTVLAPLAAEWNAMEMQRKKKWLGIAQRYGSMTPDERARMQHRMKEWASLSPKERATARDGFVSIQKAPKEHRSTMKETMKQQWQEYQDLPESEKAKLRIEADRKSSPTKPVR